MRTLPPARRKLLTIVLATLLGIVLLYTIVGFVVVPRVLEQQLPGISEKRLGVRAQWHEVTFNPFLLKLSARDLRLDTRDGQRLGSAQRISIDLQWAALFRREPLLDALQIEAPDVWIVRAADGSLNLPPRSASAKSRASATPSPLRLPRLRVNEATVHRGVVHFLDRSVQPEARSDVSAMDIELLSLTTETDKDGRVKVTAVLPEGGSLAWTARITLQPIASQGELRLFNVRPLVVWKHLRNRLSLAPPAGQLDFAAQYRFAYDPGKTMLSLQHVQLDASGLVLAEMPGQEPALRVARFAVEDASFDLAARQLVLPKVSLHDGFARVAVDQDGLLNWQQMFTAGAKRAPSSAGAGWQIRLSSLTLDNVALRYTDRSRLLPLEIAGESISGSAALAMAAGAGPVQLLADSMRLDAGQLLIGPLDGNAAPALRSTNVKIRGGTVDLAAHLIEMPGTELGKGELSFAVDRAGRLNWGSLFARSKPEEGSAEAGPGWTLRFPGLRASGLAARYQDHSRRRPLLVQAASIDGTLDLGVSGGKPSPVELNNMRLAGRSLRLGTTDPRAPSALQLAGAQLSKGRMSGRELELGGMRLHDGVLRFERDRQGLSNWGELLQAGTTERGAAGKAGQPWQIRLPGVQVERLALHFRDRGREVPLSVDIASLGMRADMQSGARGVRVARLDVAATQLNVGAESESAKAISANRVTLTNGGVDGRNLDLGRVELAGGMLQLTRAADGSTDLQRLFVDRVPVPVGRPASPGAPALPWHVRSRATRISALALRMVDRGRARPVCIEADSTSAQLNFDFVAGRSFMARDLELRTGPVRMLYDNATPLTRLQTLSISGGELNTAQRLIGARDIALSGGGLQVERDEKGQLTLLRALAPAPVKRSEQAAQPTVASPAGSTVSSPAGPTVAAPSGMRARASAQPAAWRYRVGRLSLEGFAAQYVDRTFTPALAVDLPVRRATLSDLDPAAAGPARFQANVGLGHAGQAELTGTLAQNGQHAEAQLNISQVDLKALQPILAQHLALALESGMLSGSSQLRFTSRGNAPPDLMSRGHLEVTDLAIKETATGDRFMAWKRLSAQPILYTSHPNRLAVGEVFIQAPAAKLLIAERGGLNLKHILKPRAAASVPASASASADRTDVQTPSMAFRVDRVRVRDGVLRYADESLVLPFDVNIKQFNGTMIGISNVPGERAELRTEGSIDPFALAKASGGIDLFSPRRFTDIRARFTNVEMPKLSPYTITFAGRAIAAGRLWLDLHYNIVDSQLLGENNVTVHNLKLGEQVEAPRARDLPLDLAARLLTNEEGVISVSVPVRGDLNNPGFDYHGLIRKAISNTLVRLATSPFRFIGRLLGLAAEKVDRIAFEPGSDILRPPQQEKLHDIADQLDERPELRVELRPTVATEADLEAMRVERVRRELARRIGLRLMPREDPGPTAYGQVATQRALEDMLKARSGAGAVEAFAAQSGGGGNQAVNLVSREGPAIGLGSPDRAFYEALFRRLVALQPLDANAISVLARQRADSIATYLIREADVDRARISTASPSTARLREGEGIESELRLRRQGTRS